jgi:hypothetical protein
MAVDTVSQFLGLRTDTPASQCPSGYSPDCSDVVFQVSAFSTRPPLRAKLTMPAEIVYDESFTGRDGNTYRVVVDVNGAMWSVAADGTHTQIDQVAAGSSVNGVTAYGRQYMAFFNAQGGCDAPRQWDGTNLYRVAQGGPGAAPAFAPSALTTDRYPILSISQPPARSRGSSYFLQSSGPGSTAPGTTVTAYYSDSTLAGPDTDLEDAFNSGFPVYVYFSFTGGPSEQGPYTVLVTGIGKASPPGQPRQFYYFTFEVPTTAYVYYQGSGHPGYTANYQRTLATIQTSVPVPGVSIGDTITVTGTSVSNWNADWPVQQTPLSGNLAITQTSLTGGVATYNYAVVSGVAPVAGQKITITGTLNAGGILNVTEKAIATASGGEIGSFTIGGFAGSDFPPATESGSGITDGTEFLIEPALPVVGTSTSPIYPASAGGFLVFAGTTATISPGQRQGVVFFITDTDFDTAPSPVAAFTIPANTGAIAVSGLPIGPANVKARGVAFTPANGSRFFVMLLPASVNGTITGTSTVVNDNTSDTATFQFSDGALQSGIAIDIPGNNQFQQVTLDTPSGVQWYDDRLFWKGGRNKVTSLINMEMDGGTLKGSANPLGWTIVGTSGAIQQVGSAPAYVVTGPGTGEISQPCAKTPTYGAPILQPNQPYTLRLWTDGTAGSAVGTISSASTGFTATATILLTPGYMSANFTLPTPAAIPDDLTFVFKITGLAAGVAAAVRDLQLIYTNNPNRNPIARASYTANPEAYDQETGNIGPSDDNSELRAMFVLEESFHFITAKGLYFVQAIGNAEPSSWEPKQISDDCPAFNANAVTTGQGWAAWAGDLGFFKYGVWAPGYFGGLPENLSNLIAPTWKGVTGVTRVYNDASAQRVYVGTGAGLLVLDYHELLQQGPLKWTPWNRAPQWIGGNGFALGAKIYQLDTAAGTDDDDLGPIGGYYTFAPFGSSVFQKQYDYLGFQISGAGPMTPFLYPKTLENSPSTLKMGPLETLIDTVAEWQSLALRGRLLYLKLGQPGVQFSFQQAACSYQMDPNAPISGTR